MRKAALKTIFRKDGQVALLFRGRVMMKGTFDDIEAFKVGWFASRGGITQIEQRDAMTLTLKAKHEVSFALAKDIARYNQFLTPAQVIAAIAEGKRVYTSFSYYQKA